MMYLQGLPRQRPPYSDWCAQVERKAARLLGSSVTMDRASPMIHAYFDCGLSAHEVAVELALNT